MWKVLSGSNPGLTHFEMVHVKGVYVCVCVLLPCLSPGGSSLTKRTPELQDQPPAKRVDSFSLTGSEGRVEAVGFSSCK